MVSQGRGCPNKRGSRNESWQPAAGRVWPKAALRLGRAQGLLVCRRPVDLGDRLNVFVASMEEEY